MGFDFSGAERREGDFPLFVPSESVNLGSQPQTDGFPLVDRSPDAYPPDLLPPPALDGGTPEDGGEEGMPPFEPTTPLVLHRQISTPLESYVQIGDGGPDDSQSDSPPAASESERESDLPPAATGGGDVPPSPPDVPVPMDPPEEPEPSREVEPRLKMPFDAAVRFADLLPPSTPEAKAEVATVFRAIGDQARADHPELRDVTIVDGQPHEEIRLDYIDQRHNWVASAVVRRDAIEITFEGSEGEGLTHTYTLNDEGAVLRSSQDARRQQDSPELGTLPLADMIRAERQAAADLEQLRQFGLGLGEAPHASAIEMQYVAGIIGGAEAARYSFSDLDEVTQMRDINADWYPIQEPDAHAAGILFSDLINTRVAEYGTTPIRIDVPDGYLEITPGLTLDRRAYLQILRSRNLTDEEIAQQPLYLTDDATIEDFEHVRNVVTLQYVVDGGALLVRREEMQTDWPQDKLLLYNGTASRRRRADLLEARAVRNFLRRPLA